MTEVPSKQTFHLHFEGENPLVRDHKIPASALLQSVQALQRMITLLAYNLEGTELKQRLRVSHEMESKYAVVFGIPKDGGYDLPYSIGYSSQLALIEEAQIVTQFRDVLNAVENEDELAFKRAVPPASLRRALASELKKMQPPPRMALHVNIEDANGSKLLSGKSVLSRIEPLISESSEIVIHPKIITGRLDALDFQNRTLKIFLPNGKPINCNYAEEREPLLVENRREWIQLRGEAELNDDGSLRALNNVTEVIEVDESSIEVLSIENHRALSRVAIPVKFDADNGCYVAEGDFHLHVVAETRDELERSVSEELAFLWREYVEVNPSTLSRDAVELRNDLQAKFGGTDAS
jgi:hypothetical protein